MKLVLYALMLNGISGAHLSSSISIQKSIQQLNRNNQQRYNEQHPGDENFLQIENKVDGLSKLLDDLSDDMTSVEIDDGSEDAAKKQPEKPTLQEPDNSQFDNDVANGLGISVDAEEKGPADVQQIELPDESEEGDLNLPESSSLVSEKSEEDNSSIMVDKVESQTATQEKKSSEDDIPSDGGASDISDADLATPAESKPAAPAPVVAAPIAESVPDASADIQTSTDSSSTSISTSNDSGLQETQDEVAATKKKFALLQAQMEANIQEVDNTRAQQADAFEHQNSDDPADQLKGLMSAQSSLKRMTSKFGAQSVTDKLSNFGQKLGIEVPAEIAQLGNNETISAALVELAVGMGKSEEEIAAALG